MEQGICPSCKRNKPGEEQKCGILSTIQIMNRAWGTTVVTMKCPNYVPKEEENAAED